MKQWTTAILLIVFIAAAGGQGGTGERDRSANYVGATWVDHEVNDDWVPACELVFGEGNCPSPVPSGVGYATCDDDSVLGLDMQGIGVVRFCKVPLQSRVLIEIEDDRVETVYAQVFCPLGEGSNYLFDVQGSGTGEVSMCSSVPTFGETVLQVRMHLPPAGEGATTGTVYLTFL